jgi:carbonic anhydrase
VVKKFFKIDISSKKGGSKMNSRRASDLDGIILSTVPFRFKGIHGCDAIVAMPISYNFAKEGLDFVEKCLGIRAFDLFGIPSISKRVEDRSETAISTFKLAIEKHRAKEIVLIEHVDFHDCGKSSRFKNKIEEDYYHKKGLIDCKANILETFPGVTIRLIYARLNDLRIGLYEPNTRILFSEIFENAEEIFMANMPYRCKDSITCDSAIVACLDFRFRRETRSCARESLGIPVFDLVGLPGSSKGLLEDSQAGWKGINVAYTKHGCKKIVLFHHSDCAPYGGLVKYNGDHNAEELMHRGELRKLKKKITDKYSDVEVLMVYARLLGNYDQIQFVLFD